MTAQAALTLLCAGGATIAALIVFIRHEIDALYWRRHVRTVGSERAARERLLIAEERAKGDAKLQAALDDALARKAVSAYAKQSANVIPFRKPTPPRSAA